MPTYVTLFKLTSQGIRSIKDAPKRLEDGIKRYEAMGGKLTAFYLTMGEYDYVTISEAPSDEVATAFTLALGSQGNVRTTTMKAFTRQQFEDIVKKIP